MNQQLHADVSQRLSACFLTGFRHAGTAIDYGFRVLLLTASWLCFAGGRVLLALGGYLAAAEEHLALSTQHLVDAQQNVGAPAAQEQNRTLTPREAVKRYPFIHRAPEGVN